MKPIFTKLSFLILFACAGTVLANAPWDGTKLIPVHRVELKDENGRKILHEESAPMPFSSVHTCGACHDYKKIKHGWHFSSEGNLEGRATEPWVLVDEKSGTALPLSRRSGTALLTPESIGMTDWDFIQAFGRHMPGGGPGEDNEEEHSKNPRWAVSGDLEINCLACHNGGKCQDMTEWVRQIARQNLRYAATAASGLGEVSGVAERLPDSWVPSDGPNKDDMVYRKPPEVLYNKSIFDSKHRALMDITKPSDARCQQCHSVADVSKERTEVTCDIHSASGMSCVSCHRNGLGHDIDRGVEGMYSCEGCHDEGTYGAPHPKHKGLPPVHLEKMHCTACHSGSVIDEDGKLATVRTSKINRLGIHGRAQWFTESPKILEPVFVKGEDGKIAPSRIMWPSFWAMSKDGNLDVMKSEDVMSKVGDILDPGSIPASILSALGSVKNTDGNAYGKPVYTLNDKVYELNYDGDLVIDDYTGTKPPDGRVFGFLVSNSVASLTQEYDTSEDYAFYSLSADQQNHLQSVIEALKPMAPAGAEPVWKLNGVLHRLVQVEYEKVAKNEADAMIKAAVDAKAAVDKRAAELGVYAEVKGTSIKMFSLTDRTELKASKSKTPKLYELKSLMRAQASADKEIKTLEIFGNNVFRNTFDKDVAKRLLVEPSDIGPAKGSNWGWLKDGKFMPFVSSSTAELVAATVAATVGADDVIMTEPQVAKALDKLGEGSIYVSQGLAFSSDGKGGLSATEHKSADPVIWPIAHDVRPAAQSLGSGKCKQCHSADSPFLFASVVPQGVLVTDLVDAKPMYEYMEISGGFHRVFGLTFAVRPLFKLFLLGMAGIAALVILAYALSGIRKISDIYQNKLIEGYVMKAACLSAIILTITGFCTAVCIGRTMGGWSLLSHVAFGALYALAVAVLALMRAKGYMLEPEQDQYTMIQKLCFWVLVVSAIALVATVLLSMVPLFSSHCQHGIVLVHKLAAVVSLAAAAGYAFFRKR